MSLLGKLLGASLAAWNTGLYFLQSSQPHFDSCSSQDQSHSLLPLGILEISSQRVFVLSRINIPVLQNCSQNRGPQVCGRSFAGIVGSNPARSMNVCLLLGTCVDRQRSLHRADHSSRGVLPSVIEKLWPTRGCCAMERSDRTRLNNEELPYVYSLPNISLFLHSFSSLSYHRSKASSKASCPRSGIQSFLFQMRVSSPFLKVIQQLPTSSSVSSCHLYPTLYLSFNNPLQKAASTQNVTISVRLPFTYFMQDIPPLLDSKQYFFISHMISPTDLFHPPPAPLFKTFQVFLIYCPKCPSFSTILSNARTLVSYLN